MSLRPTDNSREHERVRFPFTSRVSGLTIIPESGTSPETEETAEDSPITTRTVTVVSNTGQTLSTSQITPNSVPPKDARRTVKIIPSADKTVSDIGTPTDNTRTKTIVPKIWSSLTTPPRSQNPISPKQTITTTQSRPSVVTSIQYSPHPSKALSVPLIPVNAPSTESAALTPSAVPSCSPNIRAETETGSQHLKKYKCPQCRMCYVRRAYLIKHVMGQHSSQNCCIKCMQIFNTEKEYKQHMLNFHSRFNCDICGAAFPRKFDLKHHADTHRDYRDNLFKCMFTNCSFSHNRFTYFVYHINKHRKKRPFCCGKCKKQFCSRYIFNRHVQVCIGDFGKCPKCEREFSSDSMLYDHIQTCHLEKTFVCPECDKTYKWRASLSRHLTLDH